MAKNYYATKRGYDRHNKTEVKDFITTDWLEAKPLIAGYEEARYKGFETETEAQTWLENVDRIDAEKRAKRQIEEVRQDLGINPYEALSISDIDDVDSSKDVRELTDYYMLDGVRIYKRQGFTKEQTCYEIMSRLYRALETAYRK